MLSPVRPWAQVEESSLAELSSLGDGGLVNANSTVTRLKPLSAKPDRLTGDRQVVTSLKYY